MKIYLKNPFRILTVKISFFKKCATISHSICTLLFSIKIWFWVEHESKLVVPNKWDNFRLNLCISIAELVEPLHKNHFKKKKPFINSLFISFRLQKENSIWLTYDNPKFFPKIIWFFRQITMMQNTNIYDICIAKQDSKGISCIT